VADTAANSSPEATDAVNEQLAAQLVEQADLKA
jgi:hypothetical protein